MTIRSEFEVWRDEITRERVTFRQRIAAWFRSLLGEFA